MASKENFIFSSIKYLINDGYSKEIIATLINRDKDTINNWCKILFNGLTFTEIRNLFIEKKLSWLVYKGLKIDEMDELLKGMSKRTIYRYLNKFWDGLNNARAILWFPLVQALIIENCNGFQVCSLLHRGTDTKAPSQLTKRLFWGFNFSQAKLFFKNGYLN